MKQNYITLFFYDKKTMLTILQLIKFYIKRYILNLRCSVLYCFLFTLLVCACKEKTNEEKIREGKVSPEELINEIALKKQWRNISIIGQVDAFKFIYKRDDNVNTYLGEINLKNEAYSECYVDSELKGFIHDINYVQKSTDSKMVALLQKNIDKYSPNTFILLIKPDSTMSITHYEHEFAGFIKDGFTLKDIRVEIANMEMYSFANITKEGITPTGTLYNADGRICGDAKDIQSEENVRDFINETINRILDVEFENEIENVFNSFQSIDDLVEIGSQNAMRFNDQYRNRTLMVKGEVIDIDEPWLSSYTYRIKMNKCTVLTNDRSVLNLNKREIGYIVGTCTNFDSNTYSIMIEDGKVFSFNDIKERARQSLLKSGRVNHLLNNDIDYSIYVENLENPLKLESDINISSDKWNTSISQIENSTFDVQSELREKIDQWNNLHSLSIINSSYSESLYDKEVDFYGQKLSSNECINRKVDLIKKYNSFSQKIKGDIMFNQLSDNTIRCDFTKSVETNGLYKDYEAYLVYEKKNNEWLIIKESDKITDTYFEKQNNKKKNEVVIAN